MTMAELLDLDAVNEDARWRGVVVVQRVRPVRVAKDVALRLADLPHPTRAVRLERPQGCPDASQ